MNTQGVVAIAKSGGSTKMLARRTLSGGGLVVDGSYVYWSDVDSGIVSKVSRSGGDPIDLATGLAVYRLAIDAKYLYLGSNAIEIQRIPLAGGAPELVASDEGFVSGMAVDSQFVYWSSSQSVMKTPITGGSASQVARASSSITGLALGTNELFWVDGQMLMKVSTSGGQPSRLAGDTGSGDIIADSDHVYVASFNLTKVSISDGTLENLVYIPRGAGGLVLDDTNLYWFSDSQVFKFHK